MGARRAGTTSRAVACPPAFQGTCPALKRRSSSLPVLTQTSSRLPSDLELTRATLSGNDEAARAKNIADSPARFLIDPKDHIHVRRAVRSRGLDVLGFYHSHPDHPARPSQYDLDHAWPFFSYIIVAVRAGTSEDMTSWRLREDRSAFDEESLTHAEHNQYPDAASSVHG